MVVMPGYEKGQIINTYGGQIDILPTLEHLLGIESNSFLQVGQDLCLQIIKKSLPFELPIPSSHQNILAMTDEPTILRAVLKSVILMSKLRPNWKAFVRQSVNS